MDGNPDLPIPAPAFLCGAAGEAMPLCPPLESGAHGPLETSGLQNLMAGSPSIDMEDESAFCSRPPILGAWSAASCGVGDGLSLPQAPGRMARVILVTVSSDGPMDVLSPTMSPHEWLSQEGDNWA